MSVFSPVGSSTVNAVVTPSGAAAPTVQNVTMAVAGTEYSAVLPAGTKQYLIKTRSGAKLQVAYIAATTGTTFITVPRHNFYGESDLLLGGLTVYFQSDEAAQIAEIVSWI